MIFLIRKRVVADLDVAVTGTARHGGTPIGTGNAHDLLRILPETQLGGRKEPVDDVIAAVDPVVDELVLAVRSDDEERRRLALVEPSWELDVDLVGVVEDAHRPPGRRVAADGIAETQVLDIEPAVDDTLGRLFRHCISPLERQQFVMGIAPGDRGHIRLGRAGELQVIGAPVGDDDEISAQALGDRLDQHMRPRGRAGAAHRVADHPAYGVAGRDGNDLLAWLERDVADVLRRRVELVKRALGIGIDLNGVDVAILCRLNRGRFIGLGDAIFRRSEILRGRLPFTRHGHQLPWQRQRFGHGDDLDGARRHGGERRRAEFFGVVTDLGRQTTARDFRSVNKIMLGEAPLLEKLNEHGEIKAGTMAEAREAYKVETWARKIGITRQVLVNDDLGAFSDLARRMGQAAAETEARILVTLLEAGSGNGPTLSDSKTLFHADHGNKASTGAVISDATLSAARLALRTQKGIEDCTIRVTPRNLLVPPALETTAEKWLAGIAPATAADVNPFSGSLSLVVEPRLSSATRWYVTADPGEIDGLEFAYLSGAEGPQVESRSGWDVDGVEIRVILDFGAGFIDHRGWFMNAGS